MHVEDIDWTALDGTAADAGAVAVGDKFRGLAEYGWRTAQAA